MLRILPLRFVAALFVLLLPAVPAAAQTVSPAGASTYAAAMRSYNPKLSLARAESYARSVMADAWRTHLDPRFIVSIVTVESRWRANAVSRVGARGLGQLMPATAARLGVNPRNPSDNLRGTSNYLKTLLDHFAGRPNGLQLAIAGYNAGPHAVERYHGIPPYTETRNYVTRVLRVWKQLDARIGRGFAAAPVVATRTLPATADVPAGVSAAADSVNAATAAEVAPTPPPASEVVPAAIVMAGRGH